MVFPRWRTLLLAHAVGGASVAGVVEDFTSLVQQRVGPAPSDAPPADPAASGDPFVRTPWEYPFSKWKLDGGGMPWKLFPGDAPGESSNKSDRRVEVFMRPTNKDPVAFLCCPNEQDNVMWFKDVSEPALVPFIVTPRIVPPFRKTAAVIIAPGGGFSFLDWFKEGTHIAKWLNGMGISAFVLKYRIPDITVTKPLIDAQRAVSLVRSRARFYGIDTDKIGFMGFSAGGTIAAEVSYHNERFYTDTQLDAWGFKPNFILMIYSIANPIRAAKSVPTFIAMAKDDQCVTAMGVEAYHMRLRAAGIPSEMHMYSEGMHGFGDCTMYVIGNETREACGWTANAEEWLYSKVLHTHPPLLWQFTGLRRF